ncbi:hypothetical protein [Asanoa siamensis]|uniref:Uncharacterized protein n=1 Tax=Asanoa siamensis TaxID=926357 RepID=A0ABQ4CWG8_9ACTN|nr:hypothetical protein [Asanoa siamensis]GIF75610.1 hypothetical protein Asi02nite_51280 [Asanoa siamensis]
MTVLFDGELHVHYRFVNLTEEGEAPDLSRASGGQRNGLCGAAEPGALAMVTGLHTGEVPFVVTWHDTEPPVDDAWEEIVEVSFDPPSADLALSAFEDFHEIRLPSVQSVRARFCARGMDEAGDKDVRLADEPALDSYLLELWPAPPAPDRILKQTSMRAAYWHEAAARIPPPPTPEERAAARAAAGRAEAQRRARAAAAAERQQWGGRPPSPRLRELRGNARNMARTHRDLLDELADLPAATQREVAHWLACQAFTLAGMTGDPLAAAALDALESGAPLPPPFADERSAFAYLHPDPSRLTGTVVFLSVDEAPHRPHPIHRPSFAVPALFGATESDPLQAVVEAFTHARATFDDRADELDAALRARFLA